MRFVNSQLLRCVRSRPFHFVLLFFWRIVVDTIERDITRGLHGELNPRRNLVDPRAVLRFQVNLDSRTVRDTRRPVRIRRNGHFKHAKIVLSHPNSVRVGGPVVEVTEQARRFCTRSPLSVRNLSGLLVSGETHLFVASGETFNPSFFVVFDRLPQISELIPPVTQVTFVVFQRTVHRADAETVPFQRRELEASVSLRILVHFRDAKRGNGSRCSWWSRCDIRGGGGGRLWRRCHRRRGHGRLDRFLFFQTHAKLLVLLGEFLNRLRDIVEIDVIFRAFHDDRRLTTTKSARSRRRGDPLLLLLLLSARLFWIFERGEKRVIKVSLSNRKING